MSANPTTGRAGRRLVFAGLLAAAVSAAFVGVPFAALPHDSSRSTGPAARITAAPRWPGPALALRSQTSSRTVAPGATAVYRLQIGRHGRLIRPSIHGRPRVAARVWLSVSTTLPSGVVDTFDPRSTRATRTTLTLRTGVRTRPGTYRVHLTAKGRLHPGPRTPRRRARMVVTLVVAARQPSAGASQQQPTSPPQPAGISQPPLTGTVAPEQQVGFTITGRAAGWLAPGVAAPLDLILTNARAFAIKVVDLEVRVSAVHAPEADAAHPAPSATSRSTASQAPTASCWRRRARRASARSASLRRNCRRSRCWRGRSTRMAASTRR